MKIKIEITDRELDALVCVVSSFKDTIPEGSRSCLEDAKAVDRVIKKAEKEIKKGGKMKAEKPIETKTGIYTKLGLDTGDFYVYKKMQGQNDKIAAVININSFALTEEEKLELSEMVLSIGKKPKN